ncbi:hypothetical protein A2U01_0068215, partial [Trifolium medium]|nr:hypothetical protein [Trifolium medium]
MLIHSACRGSAVANRSASGGSGEGGGLRKFVCILLLSASALAYPPLFKATLRSGSLAGGSCREKTTT